MIEPNMADDVEKDQIIYCVWAARKYRSLTNISKVRFGLGVHGPWSSVTPDADPYVGVTVYCAQGEIRFEVEDVFELIRELCEIADYYS